MSEVDTLPPPELRSEPIATVAWEDERREFHRHLPKLLPTHEGRYVAVYRGVVIAEGSDQVEVAMQAYSQAGYVPIYVGLVTDAPSRPVRLPSPRLLADGGRW